MLKIIKIISQATNEIVRAVEKREVRTTDPIYWGDDYPREGCVITIDVVDSEYRVSITEPGGKTIEWYSPKTAAQLARMIREWCEGKAPRTYDKSDQSLSGAPATV